MTTKNLLVELVVEELPPKALQKLGQAFGKTLFVGLQSNDFLEDGAALSVFATPRRLAAHITRVRSISPPRERVTKLMPKAIGLDAQNKPTAALEKKIRSLYPGDIDVESILAERVKVENDGKAELLIHREMAAGSPLAMRLEKAIQDAVEALPVPKVMSYQLPSGETVHFVRPAHRLLALHGGEAVEGMNVLGLASQRETLGHRFLCALPHASFDVPHADAYAVTLKEQGKVIAGFDERKEAIRAALLAKAGDDQVLMPEALLDEVTALVEWPVVYECRFEESFLSVPQECLILTMQTNQKYFALTDAQGKLRPRFLIVSNIETSNPAHIIQGNERVVRPRLSDAQFFFEQDKKKPLASRVPQLANVVYHNKLGNQLERTQRIAALAGTIAGMMGADMALAQRGATLAKADLLTDMVGEFPELQGIMGTYYARHDGEPEEVARTASEHYQPRFAGDSLPDTTTGTVVALADKLETLVGIWGIGLQPTGDKDPFALRRHALGVLRMLIEKRLPLPLGALLQETAALFQSMAAFTDSSGDVRAFLMDRLRGLLRERGHAVSAVEAIVAQQPDRLDNLLERLEAVREFAALPEAEALAAANKRITNILRKTDAANGMVDEALLREPAEQRLHAAMASVQPEADSAYAAGDYTGALKTLARLRDDVDAFFNDVMVMAEEEDLRRNRLALLARLHGMLNRVADISKLAA